MTWFAALFSRLGRPPAVPAGGQPLDISSVGLDLVKHFESLRLAAYQDTGGVWTIGYGHTGLQHRDGTVYPGRKVTEAEALRLLAYDMNQFENRVRALVKVPLLQHEFDALVSFDFNSGGLTVERGRPSQLLTALNDGNRKEAMVQLLRWVHDAGRVQPGLVRRRNAEKEMFEGRNWEKFKL